MKKVFVLGLILLLIVVLCSACGKTETEVLTEDDLPDEEIQEEVQEEVVSEATQEEVQEEVNNELVSGNDELAILRVTEEMAREVEGVYLKRGENYYTFGSRIPHKMLDVLYDNVVAFNPGGEVTFYSCIDNFSLGLKEYEMYSLGDVPVPILRADDLVVGFYSDNVLNCRIYEAEFVGNSIFIDKNHCVLYNSATNKMVTIEDNNCELRDSAGNIIEDFKRLEKGENYTFSWYTGSQYNELNLICNGKNYVSGSECIEIEPQFTQEGYVVYDFSSLAPGLYRVNDFGLVEIE